MRDTIDSARLAKHTHTHCVLWFGRRQAGKGPGRSKDGWRVGTGKEGARSGWGRERGIEGREGGSDDARKGESVSGGRVGWRRDGTRHGQREGKMGGRERAGEGLSEEGREQGGRWSREGRKGGIPRRAQASVQYIHKPFHNAALGLESFTVDTLCTVFLLSVVIDYNR